jgi:myo-inositol-1(or 4)-monophosphatase
LNPWDVAAGALIVEEAGGTVTDFNAGTQYVFGEEIVASNGAIHAELIGPIGKFFGR